MISSRSVRHPSEKNDRFTESTGRTAEKKPACRKNPFEEASIGQSRRSDSTHPAASIQPMRGAKKNPSIKSTGARSSQIHFKRGKKHLSFAPSNIPVGRDGKPPSVFIRA